VTRSQILIRSTSSSVIASLVRSYSLVVRGLSCAAIACAFSSDPPPSRIGRDAGCPEHVAAEFLREPRICGTPADHAVGVDAVHRVRSERIASADRGPEERALIVPTNPGREEVFVDIGFELVMCWHLVALAALLVKPQPPALTQSLTAFRSTSGLAVTRSCGNGR